MKKLIVTLATIGICSSSFGYIYDTGKNVSVEVVKSTCKGLSNCGVEFISKSKTSKKINYN